MSATGLIFPELAMAQNYHFLSKPPQQMPFFILHFCPALFTLHYFLSLLYKKKKVLYMYSYVDMVDNFGPKFIPRKAKHSQDLPTMKVLDNQ